MKQFVKSNFPRREDDNYPTIDTRCVDGLVDQIGISSPVVDVCGKNGSAIVDYLNNKNFVAFGVRDAFSESFDANWIVTNTPYKRPLVDDIIRKQIERVESNYVTGLAILVRNNFDFAKSRKDMFETSSYMGRLNLCFRPWWTEEREQEPIHNYVWHIWRCYGTDFPKVWYYYAPYDKRYVVQKSKS